MDNIQQKTNSEIIDSKININKKVDFNWLFKSVIIWILAPISGLFFLKETDMFTINNVRQSLVAGVLLILFTIFISIFIPSIIAVFSTIAGIFVIVMGLEMYFKNPRKLPIIDDIVKKIWK